MFKGRFGRAAKLALTAMAALAFFVPGVAAQQVSIIRDAEVEAMIRDFARPLMVAAGVPRSNPRVNLVADRQFNAFVVEDGTIYVNYGTILDVSSPNALKGVLAHEIGHLAGGHLALLRERAEITGRLQVVAMILGIGAVAASAGGSNNGQAGQLASALILASQSVGQNSLLAFQRSEESAADAAALKLLDRTGQSGRGMVEVLKGFSEDEIAQTEAASYLRTHPMASDRLVAVEKAARASRNWGHTDSAADVSRLALAKAKLVGFLESQSTTLSRYPNKDKSAAARYARIITAYKSGAGVGAIGQMSALADASPSNPYFRELLGQMYFETGQPAKALPHLKRAVALAQKETQIRVLYGQALVDAGGKANLGEAVKQLNRVVREEPDSVRGFNLLSRAYAGLGSDGEATLAAAEAAMIRGDKGTALGLARKAQGQLEKGKPAWLKADDILSLAR